MMRKTFLMNAIVILFEVAMIVTVITQFERLRLLTMLILLPTVFLMTTVTQDCNKKVDFILTIESLFVLIQGAIWDMAVFHRGVWVWIFILSMTFIIYDIYFHYNNRIEK